MSTRLTALAAAISSLTLLTACGSGGNDSVNPDTTTTGIAAPATAEGAWVGTTGSGRTISAVVTRQGAYWLGYSAVGDSSTPAGFYSGAGVSASGAFTERTALREFNFEGAGALAGELTGATYTQSSGYTAANTLGGSLAADASAPGPTEYDITISDTQYFAAANGNLIWSGAGKYDSATGIATYKGHIELPAYSVVIDFDQVITMDASTGKGTMALFTNCTDPIPNGTSCQGFKSALAGPMKNTLGGDLQIGNPDGMDPTPTQSKTAVAFTPTDGGQYIWTLQVYNAGTDSNGDPPTLVYSPTPLVVGMAKQLSSITADTFTSTYNATYELTPELTKIAGSYSVGATGIETAMHTTTYILTIASDGSVSGLEPDTQCAYAGSLAPHDAGNLYDISVTFSGTGCPYAGQSFAGVARIDGSDSAVDPVVITATNTARTKGFMVVGKQ